jgi:hypothetical protein
VELKDYDCAASLKVYNMGIPSDHLSKQETMKAEAKLAATGFKKRKCHLVQASLDKYPPQWARNIDKKDQLTTHAHWVSHWWARAFTQLSAQGAVGTGSLSVSDLVTEFLNMNQLAIQYGSRVAWQYDKDMWETVSDKIKRKMEVDIQGTFKKVTKEEKSAAIDEVCRQKDKQEKDKPGKQRYNPTSQTQYGGSSGSGSQWQKGGGNRNHGDKDKGQGKGGRNQDDQAKKGRGKDAGKGQGKPQKYLPIPTKPGKKGQ